MIDLPDKRFSVTAFAAMYKEGDRLMRMFDLDPSEALSKAATDAGEARLGPILYLLWDRACDYMIDWCEDLYSLQERHPYD